MKPLFVIIVWVIFAVGNVAVAEWNNSVRLKRIANKNPKQIEHGLYAAGYTLLCLVIFYISRNYWELTSLLLLRVGLFAIAYNKFSGNPGFYLSPTTSSRWDQLLRKIGFKSIEAVAIISFALSLIFIGLQLFNI